MKHLHILANGEIREISAEEFSNILLKQRNWLNKKMIARVHNDEIWIHKGKTSIWLRRKTLQKILESE